MLYHKCTGVLTLKTDNNIIHKKNVDMYIKVDKNMLEFLSFWIKSQISLNLQVWLNTTGHKVAN